MYKKFEFWVFVCGINLIASQALNHIDNKLNAEAEPQNAALNIYDEKLYEEHENECFAQHRFSYNGTCYEIGKQGPCQPQELFVLDDSPNASKLLRPICKKKQCTEKNQLWWKDTNKCEKMKSIKTLCPGKNKKVTIDPYGNGHCQCTEGTGKMEGKDDCFEYYKQESCAFYEVVTYNPRTGYATCFPDRCLAKNSIRNKRSLSSDYHHVGHYKDTTHSNKGKKRNRRATTPIKMYAPLEGTGECYKLGSADPCGENDYQLRFIVDPLTFVPRCTNRNLQLSSIGGAAFCRTDQNNKCIDSVGVKSEARSAHLKKFMNM